MTETATAHPGGPSLLPINQGRHRCNSGPCTVPSRHGSASPREAPPCTLTSPTYSPRPAPRCLQGTPPSNGHRVHNASLARAGHGTAGTQCSPSAPPCGSTCCACEKQATVGPQTGLHVHAGQGRQAEQAPVPRVRASSLCWPHPAVGMLLQDRGQQLSRRMRRDTRVPLQIFRWTFSSGLQKVLMDFLATVPFDLSRV